METEKTTATYHGDTSDFTIIDRALAGDQLAYEELFKKYQPRILRYFVGSLKYKTNDAEDLVQDTFNSAFSKLHTFKKESGFYTWLHKIALNVFLMYCRLKKPCFIPIDKIRVSSITSEGLIIQGMSSGSNNGFYPEKGSDIGLPDHTTENVLNRIVLEQLMQNLPSGYKEAVTLHDLKGMAHKDIAALLGCSIGNVKAQRHRAVRKLSAIAQAQATSV